MTCAHAIAYPVLLTILYYILPYARIGTANGVGFYERPPESMRAEELEPPEPGAQRLWDGNTDVDAYDDAQQPGRSRTDFDYSDGVLFHCSHRTLCSLNLPTIAFPDILYSLKSVRHVEAHIIHMLWLALKYLFYMVMALLYAEPVSATARDSGSGFGDGLTAAAAARRYAARTPQTPRAHITSLLQGMHRSMLAPDSNTSMMDIEKAAQG